MPVPAGMLGPNNDLSTNVGMVRLLATDVSTTAPLFTDAQIQAFLTLEGDDVRRAAAQALDTIASSEALVSKKISSTDGASGSLSTDGPAVARELRERAAALRQQVTDTWSGFEVVDYDPLYTAARYELAE